jgi:amino acid transporter
VSAGVAALTSAFPTFGSQRVAIAIAIVIFITLVNLRGVKESGTFFAIPTYAFVIGILSMIAYGAIRVVTGNMPIPSGTQEIESARQALTASSELTLFIILRAYAAGCTALTGVEAISNGIPAFKPPESRNAGQTLIAMVLLLCTMFVGITFLANNFPITVEANSESTTLSQISREIFGEGIIFYYIQFSTLLILSLAANTAFADFPRLASLIAADRYLPRQLTNWGDRLVYSNGIITLSVIAGILILIFGAREHNLLPLYAVGVFISFTLSQSGMVIHWLKERNKEEFIPDYKWRFRIGLNAFGAVCTFIVGIILMATKFVEGAWIVMVAIPVLMSLFGFINRHYRIVAESLTLDGIDPGPVRAPRSDRNHVPVVVLMNSLNRCSLQALEYAISVSDNVHACSIELDPNYSQRLRHRWSEWNLDEIPLDVIPSPYREIGRPLLEYLHRLDDQSTESIPTMVVLPEFVVTHWWERLLHNGTSVTIRDVLFHDQIEQGRGRPIIHVPYRIGDELYQPELLGDCQPV